MYLSKYIGNMECDVFAVYKVYIQLYMALD